MSTWLMPPHACMLHAGPTLLPSPVPSPFPYLSRCFPGAAATRLGGSLAPRAPSPSASPPAPTRPPALTAPGGGCTLGRGAAHPRLTCWR